MAGAMEHTLSPAIEALVLKGMARFPDGPPKTGFIQDLQDRVNRLAAAEDDAERDGIASALIISLRSSDDPAMSRGGRLSEVAETLIDAASVHNAVSRDRGSIDAHTRNTMRGLHNTLQAVYAAVVLPEELDRGDAPEAP